MTAQFIRKPGNVFLTPEPVQVPNATHIGARFQDWVNVANEMVAEVEPAPTLTRKPELQAETKPVTTLADGRAFCFPEKEKQNGNGFAHRRRNEQNPRPSVKPLGDPNEVRVSYIEKYTLKKVSIYRGDPFPELQARCQAYADNHDVIVHLHTARNFEVFKPEPKPTNLQALLAKVDAILQGGAK